MDGKAISTAYLVGGTGVASTSISAGSTNFETGIAGANYYFEVFGPPGQVPVLLSANGEVDVQHYSEPTLDNPEQRDYATAQFVSPFFNVIINAGERGNEVPTNKFNFTTPELIATNTAYLITVDVQAQAFGTVATIYPGPFVTGTVNAKVDPDVTLGAGVDPSVYTLEFSADATPVPLPAAAWLMLSGMCGLGTFMRKRAEN